MLDTSYDFACPDWWEKLQAGQVPIADLPIDEELAHVITVFFNHLRLPDVAGQPYLEEACGDWFREIMVTFLAATDPETKMKLVQEMFVLVPKKNSKTTYSGGLGLTALYINERPNANMVIIGPTQAIADRCFEQAHGMIVADERLSKIFLVKEHLKQIIRRKTGAKLQVKTFDLRVVTGEIPQLTIFDEVHILGNTAHGKRVLRQIRGSGVTKHQSQILFITTQSDTEPQGVFAEELAKARKIRDGDGGKNPVMLPVLYEFPMDMQRDEKEPWLNKALWPFVMPNLGLSLTIEGLVRDYENNAKESRESELTWYSQHLNIQIGEGMSGENWVGAPLWSDTAMPGVTLETIINDCEVCVVGIDGGGMDDLLGLSIIGRHSKTKDWISWSRAWVHKIGLERRKKNNERMESYAADGDLVICDHPTQDIEEVAELCAMLHVAGLLPEQRAVGLDPEGVTAIIDALVEVGISADQLCSVTQGYKLNGAIKGTERKLFAKSLRHADQPLMDWCVSNARAEKRGNAVVVTKAVSGSGKIDPLMALFNGVTLMSWNPEATGKGMDEFLSNPVMSV